MPPAQCDAKVAKQERSGGGTGTARDGKRGRVGGGWCVLLCVLLVVIRAEFFKFSVDAPFRRQTMKNRRHHNNKGLRSIKSGSVRRAVKIIARKLGIPYKQK